VRYDADNDRKEIQLYEVSINYCIITLNLTTIKNTSFQFSCTGCTPNQEGHSPDISLILHWLLQCSPWFNIDPEKTFIHYAYHNASRFMQRLPYLSKEVYFNFIMKKENYLQQSFSCSFFSVLENHFFRERNKKFPWNFLDFYLTLVKFLDFSQLYFWAKQISSIWQKPSCTLYSNMYIHAYSCIWYLYTYT